MTDHTDALHNWVSGDRFRIDGSIIASGHGRLQSFIEQLKKEGELPANIHLEKVDFEKLQHEFSKL